ncbi:MAG: hypothetical protein JST11_12155 [Acidobacteria bacterium]|nr:hypothetical protein [Acidobacteriota bacterium]
MIEARLGPDGGLTFQPVDLARYGRPTGFKTVAVGVGKEEYRLTLVQHHLRDANRSGQDGTEFPHCLVNMAVWRRDPFDLRLLPWYRTEADALERFRPHAPDPEPDACAASFGGGVQIELRRESKSRWLMWEVRAGRRLRRADFASPSLRHAQATAVAWYGPEMSEWTALKEGRRPRIAADRGGHRHGDE